MKSQDLVKFITQELVQYMHTPKDERQQKKHQRREQRGRWSEHLFGVLPISLGMAFRSAKRNSSEVLQEVKKRIKK